MDGCVCPNRSMIKCTLSSIDLLRHIQHSTMNKIPGTDGDLELVSAHENPIAR